MNNSSRVAKNTISLYIRMIFLTLISLFTVRIVLKSLGAEDYGLYNVVAGFVSMFGFISGTLSIASQRFFSIYIGKNDWNNLNKYFSVNLNVYFFFSIIIIIIAETFGLWFVLNKMVIPSDRLVASLYVYQFSIISFIITLIASPFLALFVADENLSVYSFVSIAEGVLKILVAYFLYKSSSDKLIIYGLLLLIVTIITNLFYLIYCLNKYKMLKYKYIKDKVVYKEVFSFLNWNMIGAIANVSRSQGVNVVINIFFGPIINAARGICTQVSNVIVSFSVNFMKAVDPQITKNYAKGEQEKFHSTVITASKISYFLLFIVSLPLIHNIEYVYFIWLQNIPNYTISFTVLTLIDALLMALTDPLSTGVQAIGKIKYYQIVVGGLFILNIPISYIILKLYHNPIVPFIVSLIITFLMAIGKVIFFKKLSGLKILTYIISVVLPTFGVTIFSLVIFMIPKADSFITLLIYVFCEVLIISFFILFIGFSKKERLVLYDLFPFLRKIILNKGKKNDNSRQR